MKYYYHNTERHFESLWAFGWEINDPAIFAITSFFDYENYA